MKELALLFGLKELALLFGVLSGVSGVLSAFAFLRGSKVLPLEMESWDGHTDSEGAFRAAASWWNKMGIGALLLAFVLSAAASLAGYYS